MSINSEFDLKTIYTFRISRVNTTVLRLEESTCVSSLCCRIDATIYIATYIALRSLDQSILQSVIKDVILK